MLQMTVIPRRSLKPKSANSRKTPLTKRNGASFRRKWATGGASQRRSSSAVIPCTSSGCAVLANDIGAYDGCGCAHADAPPFIAEGGMPGEDAPAGDGPAGRAGGDGTARGAGADRVSSAATSAVAFGKRFC